MYVPNSCYGLFIDINNTLYCSVPTLNQVISKSLDDVSNVSKIVAGTNVSGSMSNMLSAPRGIFVDTSFNLYVADSYNNRIQLFPSGQLNATTVVGNGAPETITLNFPISIVLDADGYLFIVDRSNHRIIGSGANGFRCIVGCSSAPDSTSYQLNLPRAISFDSHGNIFVADNGNTRIQKFVLGTNSSGKHK
jgi:hypothetical protein